MLENLDRKEPAQMEEVDPRQAGKPPGWRHSRNPIDTPGKPVLRN